MATPERAHPQPGEHRPAIYQIRIAGRLGSRWRAWFDGLDIEPGEQGDTLLTGPVIDQAALHGLLRKVRDLGLPLISVNEVDFQQPEGRGINSPDCLHDGTEDGA